MEAGSNRAEVDTSRPFQSVKEAVEVFGERFLLSNCPLSNHSNAKLGVPPSSSGGTAMLECLKKLEADLAETRHELVLLKERESEMELAISSLTAQFDKSLPVLSELTKAKEADICAVIEEETSEVRSDRWDEDRAEEWMASLEYLPSLSEALTIKMIEDEFGERREKRTNNHKKKHVIPLVGSMLSKIKKPT